MELPTGERMKMLAAVIALASFALAVELPVPARQSAAANSAAREGVRILLAAANAAGGARLLRVNSLAMTERGTQILSDRTIPLNVRWTIDYPYRSRGDVVYGGEPVLQICDGNTAWIIRGAKTVNVTSTIAEFERGIALFGGGWGLYQDVLLGNATGKAIGETSIGGRSAQGVAVRAPFGTLDLFFDPATHLLRAARFPAVSARGTTQAEQQWSGYRKVHGRQFAFSTVTYRGGAKFFESTVTSMKINPPVDASLFAKPKTPPGKSPAVGATSPSE